MKYSKNGREKMKGESNFGVRVLGAYPNDFNSDDNIIEIDTYNGYNFQKENVYKIKYEKEILEDVFVEREIPSLIQDLIRISLATFCADQLVEREVALKKRKEKRYRSRKIKLAIHVSDKKKWNEVKKHLQKTVSFMTYDSFRYKFKSKSTIPKDYIELKEGDSEFDSIALFSGGADSFIGSYYLREKKNKNPQYLHLSHSNTKSLVKNHLSDIFPNDSLKILGINNEYDSKEYTQFSRSFMYVSFSSAFAVANGVNKIFIPENGVIARQIGLGKGRLTTRTAHPKFLKLYNNFLKELLPKDVKIEIKNPFRYKSKREILDLIKGETKIEKSMREKLPYTISCAHDNLRRMFGGGKNTEDGEPLHCGVGVPCLIRIISTLSSDLSNKEEKVKLQYNPFTCIDYTNLEETYLPSKLNNDQIKNLEIYYRDGVLNIYEILKLAYDIKENDKELLCSKYPEFYNEKVYQLYRNFSKNVISTFEYYSQKNSSLRKVIQKFEN